MEIVVAMALVCGHDSCGNRIFEPRFETVAACDTYLLQRRMQEALQGNLIVLDDCVVTTEQKIRDWK